MAEQMRRLELEEVCRQIGSMIGDIVKGTAPGAGFAFVMFDFGGPGNIAYLSNAQRQDMIKALEELIDKLRSS